MANRRVAYEEMYSSFITNIQVTTYDASFYDVYKRPKYAHGGQTTNEILDEAVRPSLQATIDTAMQVFE